MGEGRFLLEGEEIFRRCGWASASNNLHPHIIPTNAFVDDKVVVFLV